MKHDPTTLDRGTLAAALLFAMAFAAAAGCGSDEQGRSGDAKGQPAADNSAGGSAPAKAAEKRPPRDAAWPSAADMDDAGSSLKLSISVPEEPVALGLVAAVRIEVENASGKPVRCAEVVHDILSAYVEISAGDEVFRYVRIQPDYFDPVFRKGSARPYLPFITLNPGEKAATLVRFVPPAAGTYRVRGAFMGLGPRSPEPCRSEWAELKVEPDGDLRRLNVQISTDSGEIELAFFERDAMATVINFLTLVNARFYDGLTFHRVEKDRLIQGGDPSGTGTGNPDFFIPQEFNRRPHIEGAVSMARTNAHVDTAGSQFFVCFSLDADLQRFLDGQYTVFGRVAAGDATARKIGSVPVDSAMRPSEPVKILKAHLVKR